MFPVGIPFCGIVCDIWLLFFNNPAPFEHIQVLVGVNDSHQLSTFFGVPNSDHDLGEREIIAGPAEVDV